MTNSIQEPNTTAALRQRGVMRASARRWRIAAWLGLIVAGLLGTTAQAAPKTPNILFVIMDDVGIDQMRAFTYGGATWPRTPTIDTIANEGIRFRNTWSMPACSTSRAVIYTGLFPLRTRVYGALGPSDLANSQVSPFEVTLPKLLQPAGYKSALFGKFHLGLQGNNPYREAMPRKLGWDYFYGWLDETGDPSSIDKTAGGVAGPGVSYPCGFVPGADDPSGGGADEGACYAAGGGCQKLQTDAYGNPPGRQCRDRGGILDPHQQCKRSVPSNISEGFKNYSAHYVSPLVIDEGRGAPIVVPPRDIRARTYRGTVPVDAAIDWIKRQPKHQPWMASVNFASAHTPVMQPPQALIASDPTFGQDAKGASALTCFDGDENVDQASQRDLTNLMIEALDTEFARLLVSTGLAQRGLDGQLKYNPHNNDTMIIILGDNGTLGGSVKLPFDGSRAKGTAYQTGVWVPLVVAGPLVKKPDRDVRHMVNIADLYQLFGEIAGIDVPKSVPRQIDAMSMLPYLSDPGAASIRSWNFTQVDPNLQPGLTLNPPCAIGSSCTQIPVTATVCTDNGGIWYGGVLPTPPQLCCQVNQLLFPTTGYKLQPLGSVAIRNPHYKIVRNFYRGNKEPSTTTPPDCAPNDKDEFYLIDEAPFFPKLDKDGDDLLAGGIGNLGPEQKKVYLALRQQLDELLSSEPPCPGDGNRDGVVDKQDLAEWARFAALPVNSNGYNSSWYDFNLDGKTDAADLDIIRSNLGARCAR